MSEYIEREAVEKAVLRYSNGDVNKQELFMLTDLLGDITDIPTADVQPMKHGKWLSRCEGDIYDFSECSECGNMESCETPYCAQCGAKMIKDGDAE